MAKARFGTTVVGLRGTIGGVTFSQNLSSTYCKQYAYPAIKHSWSQMPVRQKLSQIGYQWDSLTAQQRLDWAAFAAAPTEQDTDPWGVQRYLTGYMWYARCAIRRSYVDNVWPSDAPTGSAPTPISALTVEAYPWGGGTSIVYWSTPSFGATDCCYIDAALSTHPYSAKPLTYYLVISAGLNNDVGPIDISFPLYFRWGVLVPAQKLFLRAWNQSETGPRSTVALATCIIG